jgi:TrmH family RNA methyltransferase
VSGPELDPRQCAERVAVYSEQTEVALVFGRESSGLSNDELDHCQFRVYIPTDPAFGSLNLAAAVLVLAYELRMAALAGTPPPVAEPRYPSATVEQMESFYQHLERTLLATGFLDPVNPRRLMRRLRRLFNRARPDQRELNILRGILTSVEGKRRPPGA